jgi:hypothetical protein
MKTLVRVLVAACAIASPVLSFAQANDQPLTRAQVRADLVRWEQAGYRPGTGDEPNYPEQIQAVEAKVAAMERASGGVAVGGAPETGASQSGAPSAGAMVRPGMSGQ